MLKVCSYSEIDIRFLILTVALGLRRCSGRVRKLVTKQLTLVISNIAALQGVMQ